MDKRFAFGPQDKEQFRIHMRMMENFSGCRVLAYCVMCNHCHLLLEVTPKPKVALTDELLLKRLGALCPKAFVTTVAKDRLRSDVRKTRDAEKIKIGNMVWK